MGLAGIATPVMEVRPMKAKQIIEKIGTLVIVGAASTAGAALWTNVLENKFNIARERITRPKNSNVIDFRDAKRRMGR